MASLNLIGAPQVAQSDASDIDRPRNVRANVDARFERVSDRRSSAGQMRLRFHRMRRWSFHGRVYAVVGGFNLCSRVGLNATEQWVSGCQAGDLHFLAAYSPVMAAFGLRLPTPL